MNAPNLVLRQLYRRIREYPTFNEWVLHTSDSQWCPTLRGLKDTDTHGANQFTAIAEIKRERLTWGR